STASRSSLLKRPDHIKRFHQKLVGQPRIQHLGSTSHRNHSKVLFAPREIEEGGKAAQCKKLRVGDELVNINGSALYGSRQEALILIKGSYRVLKIVVRRGLGGEL
uniref:Shroom family member 4 n=1 Tax=Cyprinus carpio carpio TaxID=630221 RepID=A0A9J8B5W1_CYPCA